MIDRYSPTKRQMTAVAAIVAALLLVDASVATFGGAVNWKQLERCTRTDP
jgi:hypothetical protein